MIKKMTSGNIQCEAPEGSGAKIEILHEARLVLTYKNCFMSTTWIFQSPENFAAFTEYFYSALSNLDKPLYYFFEQDGHLLQVSEAFKSSSVAALLEILAVQRFLGRHPSANFNPYILDGRFLGNIFERLTKDLKAKISAKSFDMVLISFLGLLNAIIHNDAASINPMLGVE